MVLEVSIFLKLVVDPVNKGKLLFLREAVCGAWGDVEGRREERKGGEKGTTVEWKEEEEERERERG